MAEQGHERIWYCVINRTNRVRVSTWVPTVAELYWLLEHDGWRQIGAAYEIGSFFGDLMAYTGGPDSI